MVRIAALGLCAVVGCATTGSGPRENYIILTPPDQITLPYKQRHKLDRARCTRGKLVCRNFGTRIQCTCQTRA